MNIIMKSIIILCVILCALTSVNSIKCWSCSSNIDPKCADPFDNSTFPLMDCNHERISHLSDVMLSMCHKSKHKVDNELVIVRGCAWKHQNDSSTTCLISSNRPNEVPLYCETCDYDGCNGATTISRTLALLIAPFAPLLFK
ncbi:hypothetical protein O3G_MSEX000026 [Manduca sexta]|nr:hypothetical protein O3G_MSEX000026 [Manduca sexta]